jgi:uncharacterized membrane protein
MKPNVKVGQMTSLVINGRQIPYIGNGTFHLENYATVKDGIVTFLNAEELARYNHQSPLPAPPHKPQA